MKNSVKKLCIAALFVALGVVFPAFFHLLGAGPIFLPMHIPVLVCGFVCGWRYGAACGLIVPLLSSFITGMPPLFPTAIAMTFELAAYGAVAGLLYQKWHLVPSLLSAMVMGRIVSGIANAILLGIAGKAYGLTVFLTGAFVTALPGIVLQIIFIPVLILVLEKAGFVQKIKAFA